MTRATTKEKTMEIKVTEKKVNRIGLFGKPDREGTAYRYFLKARYGDAEIRVRPRRDESPHKYLVLIRIEGDIVSELPTGYQTEKEANEAAQSYTGRGRAEVTPTGK